MQIGQAKIAIVHDDLVQFGGAERVLLGLCEIYPEASIYTSVYDGGNPTLSKAFAAKNITTTFLQKIPGWKKLYKALLPFYPIAFEQLDFTNFDIVISHTTRFAKSIITKPGTTHICYCHTPPRFLWHFSGSTDFGLGELLMSKLRIFDQISSSRVDHFIAGSQNSKTRISKIYGRASSVVYPFIDLERFTDIETFDGGYYLVISRINSYKNIDLAIKACTDLNVSLKIIGTGPRINELKKIAGLQNNKIEFLGNISDRMVAAVLAGCKALIIPGCEDFGLTSLEAQALGKPVIAFGYGGALETVIRQKTGVFFENQNVDSLIKAMNELNSIKIRAEDCMQNAFAYSKDNFTSNFKQTVASLL